MEEIKLMQVQKTQKYKDKYKHKKEEVKRLRKEMEDRMKEWDRERDVLERKIRYMENLVPKKPTSNHEYKDYSSSKNQTDSSSFPL